MDMKTDLSYDADNRLMTVTAIGEVTVEGVLATTEQIIAAKGTPADADAIWDLSGAALNRIDFTFLQEFHKKRSAIDELRGVCLVAIIIPSGVYETLFKLWKTLSADLRQTTEVFADLQAAKTWIGHDRDRA